MSQKQHYVPQFYMKYFSTDRESELLSQKEAGKEYKLINVFRRNYNATEFGVPIKNQCQENNIFGSEEDENLISEFENIHAITFQNILKNGVDNVNENDYKDLLVFVSVSYSRSKRVSKIVNQRATLWSDNLKDEIIEKNKNNIEKMTNMNDDISISVNKPYRCGLGEYKSICRYWSLLKPFFLINKTSVDFVISDSPVVLYNSVFYNNHTNDDFDVSSPGIQVFVPITPKKYLILFDANYYKPPQNTETVRSNGNIKSNIYEIKNVYHVNQLNILQFCNAVDVVLFRKTDYIDRIQQYNHMVKQINIKFAETIKKVEKGNSSLIGIGNTNYIPYKLKLPFLKPIK